MGKVSAEAETEIEKCAHEADWYAEHGPKIMADEPASTRPVNAYVSYFAAGGHPCGDAVELPDLAADPDGYSDHASR